MRSLFKSLFTIITLLAIISVSYAASVTLTWDQGVGGTVPTGYRMYRALSLDAVTCQVFTIIAGENASAINDTLIKGTTYVDTTVEEGKGYCYKATAFKITQSGLPDQESGFSNIAIAVLGFPPPGVPVILTCNLATFGVCTLQ